MSDGRFRGKSRQTTGKIERKSMKKIKQTVTAVRRFGKNLRHGIRKNAVALAIAGAVAAGALGANGQSTTPDPTTIYSSAQSDFNAAVGIAIGAIGIGAAVFFIRKGLKARM
jgi:hypothetical protein